MAKKKRKAAKKPMLLSLVNDERTPKVLGIICLFVALYLTLAFISYFFTWTTDQDKVLKYSWGLMFQGDVVVDNMLGRFGAITANSFFYWGFGLSSFGIVVILIKLGFDLMRKKPILGTIKFATHTIFIMAISSIVLEFCFYQSQFSWGGVMGQSVFIWMSNFFGKLGLLLFLVLLLILITTWFINPNLNPSLDKLSSPVGAISLPSFNFFSSGESSGGGYFEQLESKNAKDSKPTKKSANKQMAADDLGYVDLDANDTKAPADNTAVDDGSVSLEIPDVPKAKPKPKVLMDIEMEVLGEPDTQTTNKEVPMDAVLDPVKQMNEESDKLIVQKEDVTTLPPFDPTQDLSNYDYPPIDLLKDYTDQRVQIDRAELEANKNQIVETLSHYKISITGIRATIGPTVTLYEIIPTPGTKIKSIKSLENDIALSLAALGIRIIAPIPGKGTIGIEVPNKKKNIVSFREVVSTDKFQHAKMQLPLALGKTISNEVFIADLAKMPHLLIAGATGQGKSVGINSIIMSLLYKQHPSKVKIVMIDPKKVELFPYSKLDKHFLTFLEDEAEEPIITDTKKAINTLNSLTMEMDSRYDLLKLARVRNIKEYNKKFIERKLNPNKGHKYMPYIVLIIDEFADLIMTAGKEIELPIARLAQLSRAIGIHLIIATQRPTTNIITGMIKANFPARLAYKVTSQIDSRTILDTKGAEQLIGMGDMLFTIGSDVIRLQCAFVDTPEVEEVIDFIEGQQGYPEPYFLPEYSEEGDLGDGSGKAIKWSDLDQHFEDAARLVVSTQSGSTSMIQRKMQLGYNRAGRIMDQMYSLGIVGATNGSKPREVLFHTEVDLNNYLEHLKNK